ncbi:MAG: hypothetical protein EPN21_04725 [Methylococcaceae bacterium]|nr:MAG: hypothetical protein EPN21_04725 [Methylococcaceae bacterium]
MAWASAGGGKTYAVCTRSHAPRGNAVWARWVKTRLLFVRGAAAQEKTQPGKHDWVVFLTTDIHREPRRLLELYALRWAIEVYFKEAKQHLGLLKEQSNHYESRNFSY